MKETSLALASCTPDAFKIAEHSLALAGKDVHVVRIPILGPHDAYPSYRALTEQTLHATQALLDTQESAILAMSVMRESVSVRGYRNRSRKVFTIGLVGICYVGGPLGIYSAEDWLPPEEDAAFRKEVDGVLQKIQTDDPPDEETIALAKIVGNSLMAYLVIPTRLEDEVVLN